MNKRYAKKISSGMRLLDDAELDAVIGGYVAPGTGGFATVHGSAWSISPFSDPTWAVVGATGHRG